MRTAEAHIGQYESTSQLLLSWIADSNLADEALEDRILAFSENVREIHSSWKKQMHDFNASKSAVDAIEKWTLEELQ
jgi:hypothetical protein